jgi:hypothetical protein
MEIAFQIIKFVILIMTVQMEVMKEIVVRVILRLQLVDGKFDLDKEE